MPSPHDASRLASRLASRRWFLGQCGLSLGAAAAHVLPEFGAGDDAPADFRIPAKAKNVIFLFMAGAPSQLELFDYKPKLQELHGKPVPQSFLEGKRFAFMDSFFKGKLNLLGTARKFARHGERGTWISELLPHTASIADEITILRTLATDVPNHAPAKIMMNTGSPRFGRPSMGSWITYGIGSEARDLPGFVVLQSGSRGPRGGALNWGSAFLPSRFQGVPFRATGDPILNLQNPADIRPDDQRAAIDAINELNRQHQALTGDPEIATRIAAYEMAFRMQTSAPELMDLRRESDATFEMYGADRGKPSFATNCMLARRLIERGVRFVQLYHANWDHHGGPRENLTTDLEARCKEVDQGGAALVLDLKRRGMLEDTLVIWGGEFGRTPMGEPRATVGRNHHIDSGAMWLAGAGIRRGIDFGQTDDLGFAPTEDRVHIHDLHATLLHLLGIHHKKLTFRFQGRDFRLTDVHGRVLHRLLA